MTHTILTILAYTVGTGLVFLTPVAATAADVAPFSHGGWTATLRRFVDDQGFVNYKALATNRTTFDRYIQTIEETSPATHPELFPTRGDALAYYLNAYNALVFKGVLGRGPEERSVWRGLVSGLNFFVLMKVTVGGERMSLKHLEDSLIRRQFFDPRVHAALNCASVSCPRLPQQAFEGAGLEAQLDKAMSDFVNDARHVRIDGDRRVVWLSKIFDWYEDDFLALERDRGNPDPHILDYINRYRIGAFVSEHFRVKFLPYDKSINQQ